MLKILVAYFSRKGSNYISGKVVNLSEGNTSVVARKIQKFTNADLFEIKTVDPYPDGYDETTLIAQQEQNANARPKIIEPLPDISQYDTIILGYPNWWGTMPMAVMAFLENYDFTGKKVSSFCTHEGSGMGSSERDLKKLCRGAELLKGLSVHGSSVSFSDLNAESWLKASNLL